MKLWMAMAFALISQSLFAGTIDPASVSFPVMNGEVVGERYKLSEHPNKVHVFEVYSLHCGWCAKNAPQVAQLMTEYAAKAKDDEQYNRVQFLDLGIDSNPRFYQFWINRHKPPYLVVMDEGRQVYNSLKQRNGVPQTFVVDCTGKVVGNTVGYWGTDQKNSLRFAIDEALKVTCDAPAPDADAQAADQDEDTSRL